MPSRQARRARFAGSVLVAVLGTACSGGGGEGAGHGQPTGRAATGSAGVHDVKMVLELVGGESQYKFVPNNLTIEAGDLVRFHNTSGGPHNVAFWEDSIPAGAAGVLKEAMPNQMSPLSGEMIVTPDAVYEIRFSGAPAGRYGYYCLPHLQLGMVATIMVAP